MKQSYSDQIKDGRWQRKRLEIMQRDDFKCRCCGSQNNLTVHHIYYLPNKMIWEYDNEGLITVCMEHHEMLNVELSKLSGIIAFKLLNGELNLFNDIKNLTV
jgi:5-methylcytosine-specific restriction endonuclease McrA